MRATGRAAVLGLAMGGWMAVSAAAVQGPPQPRIGNTESPIPDPQSPSPGPRSPIPALVKTYCVSCHNGRLKTAGLALDAVDAARPADHPEVWERVVTRLRARSMPPVGLPRPDASTYDAVADALEAELDRAWTAVPNPGRINAVHRLNRVEYTNAIRDLFALDVDVASQLPGDETADGGFDNNASVLTISTAHLERYLSVARQVTRLAVGLPPTRPAIDTFEIPLHIVQDDRESEDLPFGSRGGIAVPYQFPVDGEYLIKVRLRRQYQDYIMGMGWPQQLDVRLDGRLLKRFTVGGGAKGRPAAASYAGDGEPGFAGDPEWEKYMQTDGDAGLELRLPVTAGPHTVGVSFVRQLWEPEGLSQPLQRGRVLTNDQIYMGHAAVNSVQIGGPFAAVRVATDTPSRRAIFTCRPAQPSDERACATTILSRVARLAYRRPATPADVQTLVDFFERGRRDGGSFDEGIQFALERVLVDPDFLLRVYRDRQSSARSAQPNVASGVSRTKAYPLSDLELASRLSFFLWNSIPDEGLIQAAERRELTRPDVLDAQVRRMLADSRAARALVDNFAAQWLNLRRVREVVVHPDLYPHYDETLLEAFEQETKLFLASTIEEDRSILDLLRADYTFVNERLARHYRLPGIYGSRFRRVTLPNAEERGGLLAHGSILATTSYPDRTSPVLRGKWLLDNIFGTPPPPPPPGVNTTLVEPPPGALPPTIRERLAQHRQNATCASCHAVIDPLGFALENFDVIGGWRTIDESGTPVDATGTTLGGASVQGLSGLRTLLLAESGQFPRTVTEKLMAYALGRRLEYYDRPSVRQIVRGAAAADYRWSSLILGIVKSPAFLMRSYE
jgi:mono/diheme cytochrome c family protein